MINFYTEDSYLSFEGSKTKGLKDIMNKIDSLTFKNIKYNFDVYDLHPSPIPDGLLIMVTGTLQMDGENTFKFSQTFQLVKTNQGNYFLFNDIFRLIM